jgi:DHA1 family multidrug resistance protein-like MFS transporter
MVNGVVRESVFGQLVYYASGRRWFQYEEENRNFVLPDRYASAPHNERLKHPKSTPKDEQRDSDHDAHRRSEAATLVDRNSRAFTEGSRDNGEKKNELRDVEKGAPGAPDASRRDQGKDPNLVDWYGPDDPECPMNVRTSPLYPHAQLLTCVRIVVVIFQALLCHV